MFNILLSLFIYINSINAQPLSIPFTLYLPDFVTAGPGNSLTYNYHVLTLCQNGVGLNNNQLRATYTVFDNQNWIVNRGVTMVEFSKCKGDFSKNCTLATNYNYTTLTVQQQTIIDLKPFCPTIDGCEIYVRVAGYPSSAFYTVEYEFTANQTVNNISYDPDRSAFTGTIVPVNIQLQYVNQYWRNSILTTGAVYQYSYFEIGYCSQNQPINSIQIAVEAPVTDPYTLIEALACPISIGDYTQCQMNYDTNCKNNKVAPFSIFTCDGPQLGNGLYIAVLPVGNGPQAFYVKAAVN